MIIHVINELEVECLPADLPEFLEIDLAKIEAGQSMHAKDIALPKGVALVAHVDAENPVIASATVPAAVVSDTAAKAPAKAKRPQRKFSLRSLSSRTVRKNGRRDPPVLTLRRVFFRSNPAGALARDDST